MAPKRARRRPAAAEPARRRPAAEVERPRGDAPSPIALERLSLEELQKLGFIKIEAATYYGQVVQVAGEVLGAALEGGQLFLELKASGTRDERLLRAVGTGSDRRLRIHVCGQACEKRLTGDRLVHAYEVVKVEKASEDWLSNIEEVVPEARDEDELARLRRELEEAKGGAETPKSKKRKRKKEKKTRAEVEDKAQVVRLDDKKEDSRERRKCT